MFPEVKLREPVDVAHEHGVYVSTDGWLKYVLIQGSDNIVDRYLKKCNDIWLGRLRPRLAINHEILANHLALASRV